MDDEGFEFRWRKKGANETEWDGLAVGEADKEGEFGEDDVLLVLKCLAETVGMIQASTSEGDRVSLCSRLGALDTTALSDS